jgi:outer membrane immunogenic protein
MSGFARRQQLLAGVAGAAIVVSLGLNTPARTQGAPMWTGFYVGGNVGYSWGNSDSIVSFFDSATGGLLAAPSDSFSMDGVIGGGQLGYNWQTGNWVWGLEADIQASGQDGSATLACGPACGVPAVSQTLNQKLEWFGTARGRLGFTVIPTVLLYATGGLAYGEIKTDGVINDPTSFSTSTVKAGWTVGAGVEAQIIGNWTAKLEYLYMDLGDVSGTTATPYSLPICNTGAGPAPCAPPHTLSTSFDSGITDNIVRLGINYKF